MQPADVVLISNAVFTGCEDAPRRLAVALRGSRILWVGKPEEATTWQGAQTEVRDFSDALIMAGFHDAHLHFFHSALYGSPLAERFLGENEADCVVRLAPLAARRPRGSWLLAQGWRDYRWNPSTRPTKHSLDAVYPDRPVALYSGDAHTLWLNSCALARLGITNASQSPEGGYYERDAAGELTGIVGEAAAMELMPRIVAEFSTEELMDAYRGFERKLNSEGITSICDVSLMAHPGLDFVREDLFLALEETGELTIRPHLFPTLLEDFARYEALREACRGDLVTVRGLKQFFDGVSSQHTAWLHDLYTNARTSDDRGAPLCDPERMRHLAMGAHERGIPVRIHTIGDEAIHVALDIIEEAQARIGKLPDGRHHSLEHLENFQPEDIARIARLGVVASVQPRHITLDPGGPERDLGAERVPLMWPFAALLRAGAVLAFGTDSPVTDTSPFDNVYMAMTRQDSKTCEPQGGWLPDERITLAQALRAYTAGSATAANHQDELGTLEAGKLADIIVLDRNPFAPEGCAHLRGEVDSDDANCARAVGGNAGACAGCGAEALPGGELHIAQAEAIKQARVQATYVGRKARLRVSARGRRIPGRKLSSHRRPCQLDASSYEDVFTTKRAPCMSRGCWLEI